MSAKNRIFAHRIEQNTRASVVLKRIPEDFEKQFGEH